MLTFTSYQNMLHYAQQPLRTSTGSSSASTASQRDVVTPIAPSNSGRLLAQKGVAWGKELWNYGLLCCDLEETSTTYRV